MDWVSYWNRGSTLYVNEVHRRAHYEAVADGIVALIDDQSAHVLDYGCGEALSAGRIASRCARLHLCDAADTVRANLSSRFAEHGGIEVLAPEDLDRIPAASVDLVVANSVVQYLDEAALLAALAAFRRLLAADGRVVFADIVPPDASALADARSLLAFAAGNGFLPAAVVGLVRTATSDYRRLRARLGLTRFREAEFIAFLASHGWRAERIRPNIGHNQNRMAFRAAPAAGPP